MEHAAFLPVMSPYSWISKHKGGVYTGLCSHTTPSQKHAHAQAGILKVHKIGIYVEHYGMYNDELL